MLESSLGSKFAQATSGASRMVKSKSMEVMKAVQEDLGEELDKVTEDMAEAAITGVTRGAGAFWNIASRYASQMFTEEDLAATPVNPSYWTGLYS